MEKKKTLLWLDDCRDPFARGNTWIETYSPVGPNVDVVWVQSYDEFEDYINEQGLPDAICFDHDLGEDSYDERTGYDAAKLVVVYCIENNCSIPEYAVQSSNPVGKEDIIGLLENYKKFCNSHE